VHPAAPQLRQRHRGLERLLGVEALERAAGGPQQAVGRRAGERVGRLGVEEHDARVGAERVAQRPRRPRHARRERGEVLSRGPGALE
jgi:hypothetical protein